jgi:DnaJ-class molecular chaperone
MTLILKQCSRCKGSGEVFRWPSGDIVECPACAGTGEEILEDHDDPRRIREPPE